MTKREIRRQAAARRGLLSEAQVAAYSRQLLAHFSLLDFDSIKTIHIFLPISEKKEPDTFLFIDWLKVNHPAIKIVVPKADFETALMHNYVYPGKDALVKNIYDILEPGKGELHTDDVDLVLIPMLAFDLQGYRVGYGKGFYDRFLQGLTAQKVGLSFFEPLDAIDDVNEHDVRMDCCITPDRVYRF